MFVDESSGAVSGLAAAVEDSSSFRELEQILIRNGFSGIQTFQDTAGIWRVVEGTVES